jgi:hypothetical protein
LIIIGCGLTGDDVEVAGDGDAAEVEEVLAGSAVSGAAALPVADVGEGVLSLDAFAESGPPGRALLALAQFGEQRFAGVDGYAASLLLVVQRPWSGQAAQVVFGKRTVLPGWKGMATPAGQVSCPAAKSRANSVLA